MNAIVITAESEPIQRVDLPKPEIKEGQCLVRINYASLNRRDQWIREGMYPNIEFGSVLGSDGCGVVEEGSKKWLNKEVILNPNVNWGIDPVAQSEEYSVLGMPTNGALAEYLIVPEDRLNKKPSHLSSEEAAAIPLAGLTAYRTVFTKGQVRKGMKVLVTGIGGGVAQFASQFSVALGADVFVTSGSDHKIVKACSQGVQAGFNYKNEDWIKEASKVGGFDVIIDSAGGDLLNAYLKLVKPGGRIVVYGSTTGVPKKMDIFKLFWSQAQIMGATMGNDQEFKEMVQFVSDHRLKPTIDETFDLEAYLLAFDRFKSTDHFGKIVLKVN